METYDVAFQIFGTEMDPNSITARIGLSPDKISAPGATFGIYKGQKRTCDVGTWSMAGSSETERIEIQIEKLLTVLRPHKEVLGELKNQGWKMRFFCGVFTENATTGISLPCGVLAESGDLGIDIEIAHYFLRSDP